MGPLTVVSKDRKLTPQQTEQAWQFYADVFQDLVTRAAQRHLMNEVEFEAIAKDERILKLRVFDDGGDLAGLSTFTNALEAWPLIEPAYFAHHWPEHYHRGAIWYIGFVGARSGQAHAYRRMVAAMHEVVSRHDGLAVMDYCDYNVDQRRLPQITDRLLSAADQRTRSDQVDAQRTFVLRFDGRPVLDGQPAR